MAKSKWDTHVKDKLILVESWARNGLTDEQIAIKLGISKDTFYKYKAKYTDFSDALKKGKEVVDVEVENALLKRALGYEVTEKTVDIKIIDGNEVKQIKEIKKHIPADVGACIFWLKNRKNDKWKDKPDEVINDNIEIKITGV